MSVGKIILKSTTRMSLNDRFTVLRQEKPSGQGQAGLEERRQQAQASRRNQRLAAQMERRPAVVAALKLKKKPQQKNETYMQRKPEPHVQHRPVKQRLAIKGRLSLPNDSRRLGNPRGRGALRGLRGATSNFRGHSFRGGRGFLVNRGVSNTFRFGGRGGMRSGMRGSRGGRFLRAIGGYRNSTQGRGGTRGRFQGGQNRGGARRVGGQGRGGRMSRGGRRGRGFNMQNGNPTREQLDQQLDDYMSKSKGDFDEPMDEVAV